MCYREFVNAESNTRYPTLIYTIYIDTYHTVYIRNYIHTYKLLVLMALNTLSCSLDYVNWNCFKKWWHDDVYINKGRMEPIFSSSCIKVATECLVHMCIYMFVYIYWNYFDIKRKTFCVRALVFRIAHFPILHNNIMYIYLYCYIGIVIKIQHRVIYYIPIYIFITIYLSLYIS